VASSFVCTLIQYNTGHFMEQLASRVGLGPMELLNNSAWRVAIVKLLIF
jgi:hypothetical protein